MVPPAGCDVMESSPFTNWILSRMLMSPKPRPLTAFRWSKPTPRSLTVSRISAEAPASFTRKCRTPLYSTAFCRASCKIRNRQSAREWKLFRPTVLPVQMKRPASRQICPKDSRKPLALTFPDTSLFIKVLRTLERKIDERLRSSTRRIAASR